MGIFTVLEERQMPGPLDDFWYEPISRWKDQAEVSPQDALSSTPVWAAVNLISGTIGSLPLILYRELENGGKERAIDLPLYNLLRWQPNSFQTAVEFMEMGQGHLCLRGNAFFRLETNRADELIAIVPLHPDRMKLKLLSGGIIEYHYTKGVGNPRVFSSEEILHVKGLSSDGLIGYSPITVATGAIALSKAAEHYGSRFFENSATPSGILSHPGKLKPEARGNIKKSWEAAHGAGKQHSVALLEEGLSWTALSVTPEEAQFIATRKYQAEEICRLFNVPPHLLMLLDRSTFSNVTEQNRSFATNCIRPWAIRWEQAIRKSILERFGDRSLETELDMDALLRPDTMQRAQANQILLQNGALTIDEWRARENMNPLDSRAGEVHWMPLNIAPVSVAEAGPSEEDTASQLRNELRSHDMEVSDSFGLRELRSLANRRKIAEATKPLIKEASQRLLRREVKTVRRMMKKQLAEIPGSRELRGTDGLFNDLEEYYHSDEFLEVISEILLPVIRTYAQQIYTQAAIEVGYPPEFTPELETFITGYMRKFANGHAKTSRQELQSLIQALDFGELLNGLDLELEKWLTDRAERMSAQQTSEGNGAFSKFTYVEAGVINLVWITVAGAQCRFCRKLAGNIISTTANFLSAGQELEGEPEGEIEGAIAEVGKIYKLVAPRNIGHPPLHKFCKCFIAPSF